MVFENLPDVATVKQLAEFLQVSEQTIKKALKSGALKGFKIMRDWRISKDAIIKWIDTK